MFKKLKYYKNELSNFIQKLKELFALLGPIKQLLVVIITASFIVFTVSAILGTSLGDTYTVFIDPPALPMLTDKSPELFVAPFLMFSGIIALSFVISVVSSGLERTIRDIRKGRLNYHGSEHTIIVHYNYKIEKILEELNLHHDTHNTMHDVVILLDDDSEIEHLQEHLKQLNYDHLRIYIRYGDILDIQRYKDLSILTVRSLIILSDYKIDDLLKMHNDVMKILNLLYAYDEFKEYLQSEAKKFTPVKAIVEFYNTSSAQERKIFSEHVRLNTDNYFRAVYPKEIVSNILNLSMLDLSYYRVWSELLSFAGYSLYFINPENKFTSLTYRDVLLQHNDGLLIGISRKDKDGKTLLIFNKHDEIINENDWFIYIAKSKNSIEVSTTAISYEKAQDIQKIKNTNKQRILIIGTHQDILEQELFNKEKSLVNSLDPSTKELFSEEFFNRWLSKNSMSEIDIIIINLDVELSYRIALNIKLAYADSMAYIDRFIFAVQNDSMQDHIKALDIKNVIIPKHLVSMYMAQVSNQVSLIDVFNILFVKDGPEISFIEIHNLEHITDDVQTLKASLIKNNMLYLGCENNNGEVIFEADDLSEAKKIIIFS